MSFLAGLPGLFSDPKFANVGLGLLGSGDQLIQQIIATIANEGRYRQGFDLLDKSRDTTEFGLKNLTDGVTGRMEQNLGDARNEWGGIEATAAGDRSRILGSLRDRYGRNMSYLEGAGTQERSDINRSFDANASANLADLTSRGLGNTTLLPGMQSLNARNRSDALGGLNERLRGQRLATDSQLSGDMISADTLLSGVLSGLRQQGYSNNQSNLSSLLGNIYSMGTNNLTANNAATNNMTNWIGNRTDTYPDSNLFAQLQQSLGAGRASPVQYPSPDFFGPSVQAGGSAAGLIGASSILAGAGGSAASAAPLLALGLVTPCIDENALIKTPEGLCRFGDIREGDTVCVPGKTNGAKVLFIQFADPEDGDELNYVRLAVGNISIRATRDHIIAGSRAGDWREGERISLWGKASQLLTSAEMSGSFRAGDMVLSGGAKQYIANGFVVDSMMKPVAKE